MACPAREMLIRFRAVRSAVMLNEAAIPTKKNPLDELVIERVSGF